MGERSFRERIIKDLKAKKINAVNLGQGCFDLLVEGKRPFVCEIKQIKLGTRGFPEDDKQFKFTKEQTREILKMKYPPFVVAFWKNEYYFFKPDWIKKQVTDLEEYDEAIMSDKIRNFRAPINYKELLKEIINFTR